MPNRTIYIRNDDLLKWEAIDNKAEWLHERLVVGVAVPAGFSSTLDGVKVAAPAQQANITEPFVPKPPDPDSGYPCCQSTTHRCKHWVWDTDAAVYRNTLTNKTLEAAL